MGMVYYRYTWISVDSLWKVWMGRCVKRQGLMGMVLYRYTQISVDSPWIVWMG